MGEQQEHQHATRTWRAAENVGTLPLIPKSGCSGKGPPHRAGGLTGTTSNPSHSPPPQFPPTRVPRILPEGPNSLQLKSKHQHHLPSLECSSRLRTKNRNSALSGVAQWVGHCPANRKVTGSIPVRAHAWVLGQVPSWGHARVNQQVFHSHINVQRLS